MVELSWRILEAEPRDSETWELLARTQFELADYDRCTATLNAWEEAVRPRPTALDDLRGDVSKAEKDQKTAERYWRLYIAARPEAVGGFEKLANLCAEEKRWRDALEFSTHGLALEETAAGLIRRAKIYLQLHEWDKALADSDKANELDPSDAAVKEWLPSLNS